MGLTVCVLCRLAKRDIAHVYVSRGPVCRECFDANSWTCDWCGTTRTVRHVGLVTWREPTGEPDSWEVRREEWHDRHSWETVVEYGVGRWCACGYLLGCGHVHTSQNAASRCARSLNREAARMGPKA